MNSEHPNSSERQQRLEEVLVAYLEAVDSGDAPDQQEFLGRHPEFSDELDEFFAGRRQLDELAAPIREAVQSADANEVTPLAAPTTGGETPQADDAGIGTRVRYFGDYELLEEIARGGMGVIYKARQVNLKRIVALKLILAGQLASEEDVRRFHTEAEAAAKLDHPGIVPIFEVGEHEGQHYFSMGYVEGQSLARKIAAGPLPPREAAELTKQIAEAVAYANGQGVIHRDLKPANVLLDKDGQPRVTDFGLAKRVEGDSSLTATGQVLGTPSYMPPEQASGKLDQVGKASDVYSLGALLYTLLTGRPPFQADNPLDTLMQVLHAEPVSPRQLNSHVPRDLETICLKSLQKEPQRRYATAAELAEDVDRYLAGEPIRARPIGTWGRMTKWAKRRPAIASLAAAVILITCAGFAAVTWQWRRAEVARREANDRATAEADARQRETKARERETKARERVECSLYANRLALAEQEWLEGYVARAERLLDECPERLRHWEWNYLKRLFHPEILTIETGLGGGGVVFSPDGKELARPSLMKDRGHSKRPYLLSFWDAASGKELRSLEQPRDEIPRSYWIPSLLVYSPDGKRLAAVARRGSKDTDCWDVTVWDLDTFRELYTLDGHEGRFCPSVAFTADGRRLAIADRKPPVRLWDAATGQQVGAIEGASGPMALHGETMVAVGGDELKLWDTTTGSELQGYRGGNIYTFREVAFSHDGKLIAAAGTSRVNVWDRTTGEVKLGLKDINRRVIFSPDSRHLAVFSIIGFNSATTIKIWDVHTFRQTATVRGGFGRAAFSPDGPRFAANSYDNTVKIWDLQRQVQPRVICSFVGNSSRPQVAFSADGRLVAVSPVSTKLEKEVENRLQYYSGRTVTVWTAATGQKLLHLRMDDDVQRAVKDLAFSRDGRMIAMVTSWNGRAEDPECEVKLWDLQTQKPSLVLRRPPTDRLSSVAFSPDGKLLVFGGHTNKVEVCDASTGKPIRTIEADARYLSFSPDGKSLATATTLEVRIWDINSGRERLTLGIAPGSHWIHAIAFSPDGRYLAAGRGKFTDNEGSITVWELDHGEEVVTMRGHRDEVTSIAFSPDGRRIISGSKDKTVKLWDVESGQEVFTLRDNPTAIYGLAFSPDGTRIAAADPGNIKVWETSDQVQGNGD